MAEITRIYLENFQVYKKADVELPGVTLLLGKSDTGKSSVIRGARCVLNAPFFKPAFIQHGTKEATIGMVLDDGSEVVRVKGKKINRYTVTGPAAKDLDAEFLDENGNFVLEKVGRSTPEVIADVLGIREIRFDRELKYMLNVAGQFDNLFLLQRGDMEKARIIGRLVGVDLFYHAIKNCTSDARSLGTDAKILTEDVERLRALEAPLLWIPKALELAQESRELFEEAQKIESCLKVRHKLEVLQREERILDWRLKGKPLADEAKSLLLDAQKHIPVIKNLHKLAELKAREKVLIPEIEKLSDAKKSHDELIKIHRVIKSVIDIQKLRAKEKVLTDQISSLGSALDNMKSTREAAKKQAKFLERFLKGKIWMAKAKKYSIFMRQCAEAHAKDTDEIKVLFEKMKAAVGVCPTCKRPLADCGEVSHG